MITWMCLTLAIGLSAFSYTYVNILQYPCSESAMWWWSLGDIKGVLSVSNCGYGWCLGFDGSFTATDWMMASRLVCFAIWAVALFLFVLV